MEESQAPASINTMFGNVENNGAPWKYAAADRLNWTEERQTIRRFADLSIKYNSKNRYLAKNEKA